MIKIERKVFEKTGAGREIIEEAYRKALNKGDITRGFVVNGQLLGADTQRINDFIFFIMDMNRKMLTFRLKKEWYEKVKSGEKTHEYRIYGDYWNKRIIDALFPEDIICLTCGYPQKDDLNRRLFAKVLKISVTDGLKSDLKVNKRVWDIEFELV